MRFGIKTAPMGTTWSAIGLAGGRPARGVRVGMELRPLRADLLGSLRALRGGLVDARGDGRQHLAVPARLPVTGMPYRHPAVLANMAATIDIVATAG